MKQNLSSYIPIMPNSNHPLKEREMEGISNGYRLAERERAQMKVEGCGHRKKKGQPLERIEDSGKRTMI